MPGVVQHLNDLGMVKIVRFDVGNKMKRTK